MQLNKKIIYTTILLAFAILFFCTSNVFASDNQYHENDLYNSMITEAFSQSSSNGYTDHNQYVLFKNELFDGYSYVCFTYNSSQFELYLGDDDIFFFRLTYSYAKYTYRCKFDSQGNFLNGERKGCNAGEQFGTNCFLSDGISKSQVLYNSNGEEVFFPIPVVETTIIAPLLEKEKMEVTMKEILGILPIVMTILVSYLALRKALQVLGNFLRTC